MNIAALRIVLLLVSIICLVTSILVLCTKKTDLYKKLVLLSVVCFAITGMALVYIYGFYLEKTISFTLTFLGLLAGFIFYIGAEVGQKEAKFEHTKKTNIISAVISLVAAIALITGIFIVKGVTGSEFMIGRFIPFILIVPTAGFCCFYFIRNLISKAGDSSYLKLLKKISIIMIVEIILGSAFMLLGAADSLLPLGIVFLVFMILQEVIVILVYGGKKHE